MRCWDYVRPIRTTVREAALRSGARVAHTEPLRTRPTHHRLSACVSEAHSEPTMTPPPSSWFQWLHHSPRLAQFRVYFARQPSLALRTCPVGQSKPCKMTTLRLSEVRRSEFGRSTIKLKRSLAKGSPMLMTRTLQLATASTSTTEREASPCRKFSRFCSKASLIGPCSAEEFF